MLREFFDFSDTARREKARFWVEIIGFPLTIVSLVLIFDQVSAQKRESEIQTILQIEDSERYINQLSMNTPEFALLIQYADNVIQTHTMIKDVDLTNKIEIERVLRHIEECNLRPSCKEINDPKEADLTLFIKKAESLLHLLPASEIIAFYEAESKKEISVYARFQVFVAIIEQLRARVDTAGHILLQEFEKMFRICSKGVMEEEFWRGKNAYEDLIFTFAIREPIKTLLKEENGTRGYHPVFLKYLKALQTFKKEPDPIFTQQYCNFK